MAVLVVAVLIKQEPEQLESIFRALIVGNLHI